MKRAFTLVEILIVIAIIGILLIVTLVAINPTRQFAQTNNAKRRIDLRAILDSVNQYSSDNKGLLPGRDANGVNTIPSGTPAYISDTGANICADVMPTYIAQLPSDPKAANGGVPITDCDNPYNTEYKIVRSADNRITVSAPLAELGETISFTR